MENNEDMSGEVVAIPQMPDYLSYTDDKYYEALIDEVLHPNTSKDKLDFIGEMASRDVYDMEEAKKSNDFFTQDKHVKDLYDEAISRANGIFDCVEYRLEQMKEAQANNNNNNNNP